MSTYLPTDSNDNPIPVMRLRPGAAHQIAAITASSAKNTTAFDNNTRVISIYADTDIYVECGDNTVTATSSSHFFPAGLYYDVSIGEPSQSTRNYIAVIAKSADGTVYISEKE